MTADGAHVVDSFGNVVRRRRIDGTPEQDLVLPDGWLGSFSSTSASAGSWR